MKSYKAGIPYNEWEVKQLRSNPELGVEYLKVALECLQDPDDRGASLLMLRAIAEAYGGLGSVAAKAGISRESLYRSLSPKGNPTLKTLVAVLNTMGLRLSVVPKERATRKRGSKLASERVSKRISKRPAKALRACAA